MINCHEQNMRALSDYVDATARYYYNADRCFSLKYALSSIYTS